MKSPLSDPAPWVMVTSSVRLRYLGAEVALATGDPDRAGALLDTVEPYLVGMTMTSYQVAMHLMRAEVARCRSTLRDAEAWTYAGLELAARHELQLLVTDALEALALLAGELGNDAHAGRLLGAAGAFRARTGYTWRPHYRRSGLDALRARLDATHLAEGAALTLDDIVALACRGRGKRQRPDSGWDSLTPTEIRVVELVAEGLPNRDIASRLFVSLATVKTHLVHVYAKLRLRTRAELAAAAAKWEFARGLAATTSSERREKSP